MKNEEGPVLRIVAVGDFAFDALRNAPVERMKLQHFVARYAESKVSS